MNPDPSESDSSQIPKELIPQPAKWLANGILVVSVAIAGAISKTYGDSIFDNLVSLLGKRLLLLSGLVLICSLGYCVYLIYRLNNRKLIWKRSVYWAKGDSTPFCAFCYDKDQKQIHLSRFINVDPEKNPESYACPVCYSTYIAKHGGNFESEL